MKIIKLIEKNFVVVLVLSMVTGLFLPTLGKGHTNLIIPFFMVIFFLTCLKVDYLDVLSHIKKPLLMVYILLMYLLVIPVVVYGIFTFINPGLALGMLLLVSVPPGTGAPLFTDLVKGNTSLSIAVSLLAYLFAPFSVSLLFFMFTNQSVQLDLWGMMQTLMLVNFLPLFAAQVVRKMAKPLVTKTQSYFGVISLCLLFVLVYLAVSNQAHEIMTQSISSMFINIFWLYVLFIFVHIFGYFMAFRMKKEDKIALSVTKTYSNIGLAIGLAATFFSPQILLLMVLAEAPWNTCLGIFKYFVKYLK